MKKKTLEIGELVAMPGAIEAIPNEEIFAALERHKNHDWGDIPKDDKESNNLALIYGERILSSYKSLEGKKFWIITEADRSSTTVLFPEEY